MIIFTSDLIIHISTSWKVGNRETERNCTMKERRTRRNRVNNSKEFKQERQKGRKNNRRKEKARE
jgi:hypothetical protein